MMPPAEEAEPESLAEAEGVSAFTAPAGDSGFTSPKPALALLDDAAGVSCVAGTSGVAAVSGTGEAWVPSEDTATSVDTAPVSGTGAEDAAPESVAVDSGAGCALPEESAPPELARALHGSPLGASTTV